VKEKLHLLRDDFRCRANQTQHWKRFKAGENGQKQIRVCRFTEIFSLSQDIFSEKIQG